MTLMRYKNLAVRALLACAFVLAAFPADSARAAPHAVIYAYFAVDGTSADESNIPPALFRRHIEEMSSGSLRVMAVPDIVRALRTHGDLPPLTIGITFESGLRSSYKNAMALLDAREIPYTLFVSPGRIDSGSPQYMSWKEVSRQAAKPHVTLGLLPYTYLPGLDMTAEQRLADLNRARARLREETGITPALFAYPYGAYDEGYRRIVANGGFDAAFALNSGPAHSGSGLYALPRYTMTEAFGSLERFRTTAATLPFPVEDLTPDTSIVTANPPVIGFSLTGDFRPDPEAISCFGSSFGEVSLLRAGEHRIEIRLSEPFPGSRGRINCIVKAHGVGESSLPDPFAEAESWHWLGLLFWFQETAGQ